jgi:uncharacterized membrane protein YhhN
VTVFWVLMAVAGAAALVDWTAVARSDTALGYVAKPTVLVALTAACAVLPDGRTDLVDRKWWFVGALVFCLAGDVVLMLPGNLFVPGLAAFLAAHGLYIVGFLQPPSPPGVPPFAFSATGLAVAAGVAAAYAAVPATLIFGALRRDGHRSLRVPVAIYLVTILSMAVMAANVGVPAALVGAVLFVVSDTLLALHRFVRPIRHGDVAVHITYHLTQGLLVLSLLH